MCRVLYSGAARQEEDLKTETGEWVEDAPAVLEEIVVPRFLDNRAEAPQALTVPMARECDWAKAKEIVTLVRLR